MDKAGPGSLLRVWEKSGNEYFSIRISPPGPVRKKNKIAPICGRFPMTIASPARKILFRKPSGRHFASKTLGFPGFADCTMLVLQSNFGFFEWNLLFFTQFALAIRVWICFWQVSWRSATILRSRVCSRTHEGQKKEREESW
jgi:hypothetical protein